MSGHLLPTPSPGARFPRHDSHCKPGLDTGGLQATDCPCESARGPAKRCVSLSGSRVRFALTSQGQLPTFQGAQPGGPSPGGLARAGLPVLYRPCTWSAGRRGAQARCRPALGHRCLGSRGRRPRTRQRAIEGGDCGGGSLVKGLEIEPPWTPVRGWGCSVKRRNGSHHSQRRRWTQGVLCQMK